MFILVISWPIYPIIIENSFDRSNGHKLQILKDITDPDSTDLPRDLGRDFSKNFTV